MNQIVLANNVHATTRDISARQRVEVTTKYVRRADDKGWLGFRPMFPHEASFVYLCEYTKLIMLKVSGRYTHFQIVDGNSGFLGKEVALSHPNVPLYLSDVGPEKVPATIRVKYAALEKDVRSEIKNFSFTQQWAVAEFAGTSVRVTLNSVWGREFTPIAPGRHRIMAPDFSHAGVDTSGYRAAYPGRVICTDVWFPIALEGAETNSTRYIHIGHMSEGCVTLYELLRWNALYEYLINKRIPGSQGRFVGYLIVEQ